MSRASSVAALLLWEGLSLALMGCPKAYPTCVPESPGQTCSAEPQPSQQPREGTSAPPPAAETTEHGSEATPEGLGAVLEPNETDILPFGSQMTRPEKISGPTPGYTKEALEHRIEGTALVQCIITVEGEARRCRLIQPLAYLESSLLDALTQSRFKPATLNGKPVSVIYTLSFEFHLPSPQKTP